LLNERLILAGGETPINNSIVLYDALKTEFPEFIDEVDKKVSLGIIFRFDKSVKLAQGVQYQLFYPNTAREDTASAGTSVLQSYGKNVLDTDTVEEARKKVEDEIRRLPTATWQWENQSENNLLGDLRVFQKLPGKPSFLALIGPIQLDGRALIPT
jgi:hypothetical protein